MSSLNPFGEPVEKLQCNVSCVEIMLNYGSQLGRHDGISTDLINKDGLSLWDLIVIDTSGKWSTGTFCLLADTSCLQLQAKTIPHLMSGLGQSLPHSKFERT